MPIRKYLNYNHLQIRMHVPWRLFLSGWGRFKKYFKIFIYDREIQLHLRFIMRCLTASELVSVLRAQWPGLSDVQAARCLHLEKFSRCKLHFSEWHTICTITNLAYSVP